MVVNSLVNKTPIPSNSCSQTAIWISIWHHLWGSNFKNRGIVLANHSFYSKCQQAFLQRRGALWFNSTRQGKTPLGQLIKVGRSSHKTDQDPNSTPKTSILNLSSLILLIRKRLQGAASRRSRWFRKYQARRTKGLWYKRGLTSPWTAHHRGFLWRSILSKVNQLI